MLSVSEVLRLLPDAKRVNARTWAGYSLLWLPLGASAANIKATVTTQDDSDFIAMRIKAYATSNAAPPIELTAPAATFTLQIGSTNLFPDNNPVHIGMFNINATKDGIAHELEYPIYIPAQTTLTGFMTDLSTVASNIRLTVFGIRILNFVKGDNQL